MVQKDWKSASARGFKNLAKENPERVAMVSHRGSWSAFTIWWPMKAPTKSCIGTLTETTTASSLPIRGSSARISCRSTSNTRPSNLSPETWTFTDSSTLTNELLPPKFINTLFSRKGDGICYRWSSASTNPRKWAVYLPEWLLKEDVMISRWPRRRVKMPLLVLNSRAQRCLSSMASQRSSILTHQ